MKCTSLKSVAVTAAVLLLSAAGSATAGLLNTLEVAGTVRSEAGPCPSGNPLGTCLSGRYVGLLTGTYTTEPTSGFMPSRTPGVVLLYSTEHIRTLAGDLFCVANALGTVEPGTDGEFVNLCEITGGTRYYEGASGYLQVYGTFTERDGVRARYAGRIRLR